MWLGLLLLFLHELASLIISNQIEHSTTPTCEFDNEEQRRYRSPTMVCYFSLIQFANNSTEWNTTDCVTACSQTFTSDSTLMWLLVLQILHGFGYMAITHFVSAPECRDIRLIDRTYGG